MNSEVLHYRTVVETCAFQRDCERTFTRAEVEELINFLALYPDAGDLIPETGGIRKLRWAALGKGKRGGARVIYYAHSATMPLYLLAVYSKGQKIDLTANDRKLMRDFVDRLLRINSGGRR
jgi:mRNA-degrading endonuclease RelE of RelBE toxin-antitoxin system